MIERLREEMTRLGINARELSQRANLGQSFVYDLLSGKSSNPTTKKLSSIAEALGVGMPYLVYGANNNNTTYGKDESFIAIPMILSNNPEDKNRHIYKNFLFHKDLLTENVSKRPESLRMVVIKENNLHPIICEGDTVLVDTSCKLPSKPGVFVIVSGESMVARHVEYTPDQNLTQVFVSKDTSKYSPHTCDVADIEVVGRVVWVSRNL